ncbi:OLC1v1026445C1 [Oldenlandia corymbosa var. corymbosa]|nr:OLC1v1026445C1 [Oldenlandia corymbosa var. corymbosa]
MIISYISYKCNRSWSSDDHHHTASSSSLSLPPVHSIIIAPQDGGGRGGLDDSALVNYPKFLYSQVKQVKGYDQVEEGEEEDAKNGVGTSGCSICLGDYKDSDMLRLLPECGHLFHLGCIDPWLKLRPTCPICRCSSPVVTPLADVVPLYLQHPNS